MGLGGGIRQAADQTPADRNRHVDLLRAFAISIVVVGHWLAVVVITEDGIDGDSALEYLSWAHPLTWILQVMPIFFLVGGFSNGASLTGHYRRGGDSAGWLLGRSARLLRPTTAFLVVLAAAGLMARLLGADPEVIGLGVWAASVPLWFLAAYSSLVFLAPLLHAAHRRYGLAFPAVLGVVVLLLDVARMQFDVPVIGGANYLLVWLIFHQIGFAWQDGTIPPRPAVAGILATAGIALLIGLAAVGPYPVSMVGVPGEDLQNTSPPTFALLILGLVQTALALMLNGAGNRFLRRLRPWTVVVAVNTVILTMFLWHMAAAVLSAIVLYTSGIMPEPAVDSGEWLLLRLPWLAFCGIVLAVLVSVFASIETRSVRRRTGQPIGDAELIPGIRLSTRAWHVIIGLGLAGVVGGLLTIGIAGSDFEGIAGLPTSALILYLVGAGLLRLARHQHTVEHDPHR